MQILIGCAKTMTQAAPAGAKHGSVPVFQSHADAIAGQLARYTPDELQAMLRVNAQIAVENWRRYREFRDRSTRLPAVFAYDGIVFQRLAPESMSDSDLSYADSHLFIASFLYGLLRPLDLISCYRLEGNVELPCTDHKPIFKYWQPVLTDWFISKVKDDDGVLVNLASNEFRDIFDWKRVKKELTVITPEFKVDKGGALKTVVVYAKMCRGAMTRWIIQNRIAGPDALRAFEYDNFRYESDWTYVLR